MYTTQQGGTETKREGRAVTNKQTIQKKTNKPDTHAQYHSIILLMSPPSLLRLHHISDRRRVRDDTLLSLSGNLLQILRDMLLKLLLRDKIVASDHDLDVIADRVEQREQSVEFGRLCVSILRLDVQRDERVNQARQRFVAVQLLGFLLIKLVPDSASRRNVGFLDFVRHIAQFLLPFQRLCSPLITVTNRRQLTLRHCSHWQSGCHIGSNGSLCRRRWRRRTSRRLRFVAVRRSTAKQAASCIAQQRT